MDNSIIKSRKSALADVEKIIDRCIAKQDIQEALILGNTLDNFQRLVGISLAKLIYMLASNWELFGIDEDYKTTLSAEWGMNKDVIERYKRVWALHAEEIIPEHYSEDILALPMKHVIPVANAINQGHVFELDDWDEFMHSYDEASVREVVRKVKGTEIKPGSITISISDEGYLTAWQDGIGDSIGVLFLDKEENSFGKKAINRIINNSRIQI